MQAEHKREEADGSIRVTGSHLGYEREFGVRHERTITLGDGGHRLTGRDLFTTPDFGDLRYTTLDAVSVRFHLHPDVMIRAEATVDNALMLETKSGEHWRFSCDEVSPELEESIFFAHITGSRRTRQIVLNFAAESTPSVNWAFRKMN